MLAELVDVTALQQDEEAIRRYAPQAEALAVRYDHRLYQGVIHRAWGVAHRLAGEYPQAKERLEKSLTILEGLNTRWQAGRTCFELGNLAMAQADPTRASQAFRQALSAFEVMKAAPDIARAKAALSQIEM